MKTRILILIAFVAVITLSFSFAASNRSQKVSAKESTAPTQVTNEPIGGFVTEDKF